MEMEDDMVPKTIMHTTTKMKIGVYLSGRKTKVRHILLTCGR